MTYVIADLHGQFDSYEKLLQKIGFSDNDTLYLLGDMIDYGDRGLDILLDAMGRSNVFPILGDHEYYALRLLSRLEKETAGKKQASAKFQEMFAAWIRDFGGMPTVSAYQALDAETRGDILAYLREECVPYDIAEAGGKTYLLVHAGLSGFDPEKELDDYAVTDMIEGEGTFPAKGPEDMIMVTGHTPTDSLDEEAGGFVLFSDRHIAIDCGAHDGGFAACLCLETGGVVYG